MKKRASWCYFLSNLVVVLNQFLKAVLHEINPRLFKLLQISQVRFVRNLHLLGDTVKVSNWRGIHLKGHLSLVLDFNSFVAYSLHFFNRDLAALHCKHSFFNLYFYFNGFVFKSEVTILRGIHFVDSFPILCPNRLSRVYKLIVICLIVVGKRFNWLHKITKDLVRLVLQSLSKSFHSLFDTSDRNWKCCQILFIFWVRTMVNCAHFTVKLIGALLQSSGELYNSLIKLITEVFNV